MHTLSTELITRNYSESAYQYVGSFRWLTAIDEVRMIGRALFDGGDEARLLKRLEKLEALIGRLKWWADDLDVPVQIEPIRGASMLVPLCQAPAMLRQLMGPLPS